MSLVAVLQSLVNGLLIGGVYALVAVGLTLIFGVMKIVNFAQGEFLMLGMYFTFWVSGLSKLNPYLVSFLLIPVFFLLGWLVYSVLIRRVVDKGDVSQILLTLGLSVFLQSVALLLWGSDFRSLASPLKTAGLRLGPVVMSLPQVIALVVALVLVLGLMLFLSRTDLGKAMRATAENREIVLTLGINPEKTYILAFGLGITFAGVAGLLLSPFFYIFPTVGSYFNLTAFIIVVLGGMGSVVGALLGGLLIGIAESVTGTFISVNLSQLASFVVFLLVLFLRPSGLFGGGELS